MASSRTSSAPLSSISWDRRTASPRSRSDPRTTSKGRRQDIVGAVARVDDGSGVVILTDMFGGTPSNLAISAMDDGRVEVLAGVNLPMLIKLARVRDEHRLPKRSRLPRRQAANTFRSPVRSWGIHLKRGRASIVRRDMEIINARGLHARASAKFVKCAEQFDALIEVTRDGQTVPGTSIMGLMMLAAQRGSTISVAASGKEASAAIEALAGLIASRFGEDQENT